MWEESCCTLTCRTLEHSLSLSLCFSPILPYLSLSLSLAQFKVTHILTLHFHWISSFFFLLHGVIYGPEVLCGEKKVEIDGIMN